MKIRFLGTSAGWPLPRLGCNCEICTSIDPKDKRTRSQILIDETILCDAGPETYQHLVGCDPTKIRVCIITHKHHDHLAGLWDLQKIYNLAQPIQIIKAKGKLERFKINSFSLTLVPVKHSESIPTCGILIEKDGKKVVYAPDFREMSKKSSGMVRGAKVLIIGGSSLTGKGRAKGHQTIEEGIILAKNLKAEAVYFVHIGHKTDKHQFLERYLRQKAGHNFHIAFDGQELVI